MRFKLFFVACFMALAGLATTATAESTDSSMQAWARTYAIAADAKVAMYTKELNERRGGDPTKTNKRIRGLLKKIHLHRVTADQIRHYYGLDQYKTKGRYPYKRISFEIRRMQEAEAALAHWDGVEGAQADAARKQFTEAIEQAMYRKDKVLKRQNDHRAKMFKRIADELGISTK